MQKIFPVLSIIALIAALFAVACCLIRQPQVTERIVVTERVSDLPPEMLSLKTEIRKLELMGDALNKRILELQVRHNEEMLKKQVSPQDFEGLQTQLKTLISEVQEQKSAIDKLNTRLDVLRASAASIPVRSSSYTPSPISQSLKEQHDQLEMIRMQNDIQDLKKREALNRK